MGLGLAIVQSIVTGYNGQIEVFNNEKGGATFRVELPAL
jgi:C4-dicarboxylate-specific signal transduction histidine kinase